MVVVWAVTRVLLAWLADHPEVYGTAVTKVTGDAELYRAWAISMIQGRLAPYRSVPIEYPPGSLPFISAPWLWVVAGGAYRTGFVALMVAVDGLGLAGVLALARRWGGRLGPWAWVGLVVLLGPITYVRLDLVPAVATIWALERAAAGAWLTSGAWIGFGTLVKLYPALLLPMVWLGGSRRRASLVAGAGVVVLVGLVPLADSFPDLAGSVVGYHSERGLQVESSWGLMLLVASRSGYPVSVAYNFGAFHVDAGIATQLRWAALGSSAAVLAGALWWSGRPPGLADVASLATAQFGMLALVLCTSPVLSPQFLLWVIALGAVAACRRGATVAWAVAALAPAAALSQLIYPYAYDRLLTANAAALVLLAARNLMLAAAGVVAVIASGRHWG